MRVVADWIGLLVRARVKFMRGRYELARDRIFRPIAIDQAGHGLRQGDRITIDNVNERPDLIRGD